MVRIERGSQSHNYWAYSVAMCSKFHNKWNANLLLTYGLMSAQCSPHYLSSSSLHLRSRSCGCSLNYYALKSLRTLKKRKQQTKVLLLLLHMAGICFLKYYYRCSQIYRPSGNSLMNHAKEAKEVLLVGWFFFHHEKTPQTCIKNLSLFIYFSSFQNTS